MAAIDFAYTEINTNTDHNFAAYTDVSGCTIASGSFTAGKKYLIQISLDAGASATGVTRNIRILHGSTVFADSELLFTGQNVASDRFRYTWFMVWTAVGGEGIKIQASGQTVKLDFVSMLALNLSDNLTENTDWFYNERDTIASPDALSTTPLNGAAVTFTPSEASDWLVLSNIQWDPGNNTTGMISTLVRSGEASSSTPTCTYTLFAASHQPVFTAGRVFSLTAVSNTFTEKSALTTGTVGTRRFSRVFALNLNKFAARSSVAYTEGSKNLPTSYVGGGTDEMQTATITPTVTGTVFVGAYWTFDVGSYARRATQRVQVYVDGGGQSDLPAGQTTAAYPYQYNSQNSQDDLPMFRFTKMTMTGSTAYRADLDAFADSTSGTPSAKNRCIWMFSAELAAAAPPPEPFMKVEIRAAP